MDSTTIKTSFVVEEEEEKEEEEKVLNEELEEVPKVVGCIDEIE